MIPRAENKTFLRYCDFSKGTAAQCAVENAGNPARFTANIQPQQTFNVRNLKTIPEICRDSMTFQALIDRVSRKLQAELNRAQTFVDDTLDSQYRAIHLYGLQWNAEEFEGRYERAGAGGSDGTELDELQAELNRMQDFKEAVEKCRASQPFGLLMINCQSLKQDLAPVPDRGLATMTGLLTRIGGRMCRDLVKNFEEVLVYAFPVLCVFCLCVSCLRVSGIHGTSTGRLRYIPNNYSPRKSPPFRKRSNPHDPYRCHALWTRDRRG